MSELLTLPLGDPEGGFVEPTQEVFDSTGVLPLEEQAWQDDHFAALEADTDRVAQAEHDIAAQRVADAETAATETHLSSVIPSWAQVGDPDLEVGVYGQNLDNTMQVLFGGGPKPTTFVSDTELRAVVGIPANEGFYDVSVSTCPDQLTFTVTPAGPSG